MSKGETNYGIEGIDGNLAEILFVDPRISIDDAEKIIHKIKKGANIAKLTDMLCTSFSTLKKYYQEITRKSDEEYDLMKLNVAEKIKSWQTRIGVPKVYEILKVHEYLSIPISELPVTSISTPKGISEVLNYYVIDQPEYVNSLSLAYHIQRMRINDTSDSLSLPGNSLLCAGNSGMGKSHPLKIINGMFDTDLQTVNCNCLVQSGIYGLSVEDSFTALFMRLKKDSNSKSRMEHAIIHFDEFDKLFSKSSHYNSRIVEEILHIIEGNTTITFRKDSGRNADTETISTKSMMFVFTGVFESLPAAVAKRLNKGNTIGFSNEKHKSLTSTGDFYNLACTEDYRSIGVIPEMLGRITNFTSVRDLDRNSYLKILNNKASSPINDYIRYFFLNDIKLHITQDARELIAKEVEKRNLGARGIKQILQIILKDEMFCLSAKGNELVINKKIVNNKLKKK